MIPARGNSENWAHGLRRFNEQPNKQGHDNEPAPHPYDEFPVLQAPHTFSHISSTDYNWDDGYYFGVFSPAEKTFLAIGLRVNPNTDMVGGYALLNLAGQQLTARFSRCWRGNYGLTIGPLSIQIVEPLRTIRLKLLDNESGLAFDILWEGISPPYLEQHHLSVIRGRRNTDQTRYSQAGKASGIIVFRDRVFDLQSSDWYAARDHSWGLYAGRPPLSPPASLLPPVHKEGPHRATRFWNVFRTGEYSGFFHMHESADGQQVKMNDVFGTPFGGRLVRGWNEDVVDLISGKHELILEAGTRILKSARVTITDSLDRVWIQEIQVVAPPWVPLTMGYTPGSWKDGGTFSTYHGSETGAFEWDEFDFSYQPVHYAPYGVIGEASSDTFGLGLDYAKPIHGIEYLVELTTVAPDGTRHRGAGQVEFIINGRYAPLGID